MSPLLVVIFVFVIFLYILWISRMRNRLVEQQRRTINSAFAAREIQSESASLNFRPSSATLVYEKETIHGANTVLVQTTRLYRNPPGEYFLFICTAGEPGFIKHLSQAEAMRMLKPYRKAYQAEFDPPAIAREP